MTCKPAKPNADFPIAAVLADVERVAATLHPTSMELLEHRDPFTLLAGCILSLRTRDAQTTQACHRLFAQARTPESLLALDQETIAGLIRPVGFYRTKAKTLLAIAQRLIDDFAGHVPSDLDVLLTLPGVGRKTANLVVTLAFGRPGICVDAHVHRIANRWGYVATKTPDQTELALRAKLPSAYWIPLNEWLVVYGQSICQPVSPWCSKCALTPHCRRVGVARSR